MSDDFYASLFHQHYDYSGSAARAKGWIESVLASTDPAEKKLEMIAAEIADWNARDSEITAKYPS